jgi:hypothetical protein
VVPELALEFGRQKPKRIRETKISFLFKIK